MKTKRNTAVLLQTDWYDIIVGIFPGDMQMQDAALAAVYRYAATGQKPADGYLNAVLATMFHYVDLAQESYEEKKKQDAERQRRRYAKEKENLTQPHATSRDLTNSHAIEKEKEKENEKEDIIIQANACTSVCTDAVASAEKKISVGVEELQEIFNAEMDKENAAIPRVTKISGKRKTFLNARIREYGIEAVFTVIRKAAKSKFLNGSGERAFVADFAWIFKPNNFPKILEGNYDDKPQTTTPNSTYHGTTSDNWQTTDARAARDEEFFRHIANQLATPYVEPDLSNDY